MPHNQITDRIWICSISEVRPLVSKEKIESVCTVLTEVEMSLIDNDIELADLLTKVRHLWIKQSDSGRFRDEDIKKFLEWMSQSLDIGRVLVHCGAGISRSPTLVIAWLICSGLSWDEAEDLVRHKRLYIDPEPSLKQSIKTFFRNVLPPPIAWGEPE